MRLRFSDCHAVQLIGNSSRAFMRDPDDVGTGSPAPQSDRTDSALDHGHPAPVTGQTVACHVASGDHESMSCCDGDHP